MTYAQFRRLRPKYKVRIVAALGVLLLLLLGSLFGLAEGLRFLTQQMRTTKLEGFAASTILRKEGYQKVLEVLGQSDASQVLVVDAEIEMTGKGAVTAVQVNLLNLTGVTTSDLWLLEAEGMDVKLRQLTSDTENRSTMALRKASMQDYFPAISRVTSLELLSWLEDNAPVGENGTYRFVDNFDNNLEPQFVTKLPEGAGALWISRTGTLSTVNESFTPVSVCAPTELYATPVDTERSTENRTVLGEEVQVTVAMFEAGNY